MIKHGREARADNVNHAVRVVIMAAFVAIAYWPSLFVPFAFDDLPNIVLNPAIRIDSPFDLRPVWEDSLRGGRRIVAMVTFAWNHWWGAYDPLSYHVVNIAIHVANGVLLYGLIYQLARSPRSPAPLAKVASVFAFTVVLIWLVHPVNTQAVTYIVQRMTSLAALFYLACLLVFVLWRSGRLRGWLAWPVIGLGFILAILTKEHTVTLPAALLLLDAAFFSGWRRYHGYCVGALVISSLIVASYAIGWPYPALLEGGGDTGRAFSRLERVLTQGRVIWHYLSLIFWPDHGRLQLDYNVVVSQGLFEPISTFWAWSVLLLSSVAAVIALPRYPWPAAGWLFFLGALSVESSVIMLEMVFEHRLYLPSTFLLAGVLAPLLALAMVRSREVLASVAALGFAGFLTLETLERNQEWMDRGAFWARDLERGASPYRSALNGAGALARQGRPIEALTLLDRIRVEELDAMSLSNVAQLRGESLAMLGRWEEALAAFSQALNETPFATRSAYAAGNALIQLERLDDAEAMLEQMERQFPENAFTTLLAARLAVAQGEPERGLEELSDWLKEHPSPSDTLVSLVRLHQANILRRVGRPDEAIRAYRLIVEHNPNYWQVWAQLASLLRDQGRQGEAERIGRRLRSKGIAVGELTRGEAGPLSGGGARGREATRRVPSSTTVDIE